MSLNRAFAFAMAVSAVTLAGAAANAQEPEESAREALERRDRGLEDVDQLRRSRDDADGSAAFEQVLTAPEDIRMNLAYARERIEAGDLKEGAAALERVLLVQPNLYSARVLYGLVLFRLQMYDRARFELEEALEGDLPPNIRAEAEVYLSRIKQLQKRTRGSLTLAGGFEWDANRNQAPSSGQVLLRLPTAPPIQFVLPADDEQADFAYIVSAQGRIRHDLGKQSGWSIFGEAGYFRSDKFEIDRLDLDAVTASIGTTWNWGNLSITPRLRGSFLWLNDADYLTTAGGELEVLYRWTPDFRTYVNLRGDDEEFRPVPSFLASGERSGSRYTGRAGAIWNLNQTMALTVEGLAMDKRAETPYESFNRYGGFAQHAWLHGGGAFTLVGLWAEHSGYDGIDPFIVNRVRDEWLYRARFTAGAPLSWFAPSLPKSVGGINLIAQYEYERVDSNILNYDYDTHKVNVLLSKRIEF